MVRWPVTVHSMQHASDTREHCPVWQPVYLIFWPLAGVFSRIWGMYSTVHSAVEPPPIFSPLTPPTQLRISPLIKRLNLPHNSARKKLSSSCYKESSCDSACYPPYKSDKLIRNHILNSVQRIPGVILIMNLCYGSVPLMYIPYSCANESSWRKSLNLKLIYRHWNRRICYWMLLAC